VCVCVCSGTGGRCSWECSRWWEDSGTINSTQMSVCVSLCVSLCLCVCVLVFVCVWVCVSAHPWGRHQEEQRKKEKRKERGYGMNGVLFGSKCFHLPFAVTN